MNLRTRYQTLMRRVTRPWARVLALVDPRHFYIGLAVALGLWIVLTTLFDRQHHLKSSSYDWMLSHRFKVPVPDPDIILLDIDERSLAAMAQDYGRWPWPRDVLATVLTELEAQGAKAVIFDILFSDADRQNPVSERAFEEAVAKSRIAYFPVLRLNRANDAKSAVRAADLKGLVVAQPARADAPAPASTRTLAVVLPYFDSAMRGGHLGTNNVDPDADSLIRRYRLWEDGDDFRVLSLPARLALDFGWPMPDAASKQLRFNDRVLAYRTLSFSDVFADLLRKERTRPAQEFRDKIVVIGGTAPGLFDLKGTPISRAHPGIDILATAIDDTKNDRFLDELSAPTDIVAALLLLVLMPWLCIRYSHEQLRLAFLIAPAILFGISYLSMNLTHTFIDLTAPASIAFLYFSLVKLYSAEVRKRWGGDDWFAPVLEPGTSHWLGCLATAVSPGNRVPGFETRYLNLLRTVAPHARMTSGLGAQTGWLGSAFSGVLVATWVQQADDEAAIDIARDEAHQLFAGLKALRKRPLPMQQRFLEDIIAPEHVTAASQRKSGDVAARNDVGLPAGGLSPALMHTVRGLVSRTVLQMAEGALP